MTPRIPQAMSRFVGAWLGAFGLAATYLVAVASGVSAPAALFRGALALAACTAAGRVLGFVLGRHLDRPRRTRTAARSST